MIFSRAQSNYCLYDLSEMSKLDEADILRRSKADSLSVIKSLQCWGMKLKDVRIPVYFYLNPTPFIPNVHVLQCTSTLH